MVRPKSMDVTARLSVTGDTGSSSGTFQPIMLGRFRLMALLGEGAMGKVLLAEDTKLKRHVALKCLKRKSGTPTERETRFVREARSAATLDHPGIVQVYEIGEAEGFHFIAMELIEGGTLGALVNGCGSLDLHRACQLCAEAAEALSYAAGHGIVHRDIKPENLLLTRAGRCKITDFGLARNDQPSEFATLDAPVGTPAYIAPEVVGGLPATAKSDVYSLAAVLFCLLTGKPPFESTDRDELLRMQIDTIPPDVRTLRPGLPESIAKIIARALSKDPDERPAAETFAQQLRAHTIPLGDSQVLSVSGPYIPSQSPEHSQPFHWWVFGSLIAGTVAVIAVVIIAALVMRRPSDLPPPMLPPIAARPQSSAANTITTPPAPPADLAAAIASTRATPLHSRDRDSLMDAARTMRSVTVIGPVAAFHAAKSEKIALLTFADNPNFAVAYHENLYGWMTRKFGGKDGDGIVGKSVRIAGVPTLVDGTVVIVLQSTNDIELAP